MKKNQRENKGWRTEFQFFMNENMTSIIKLLLIAIPTIVLLVYLNNSSDTNLDKYECETLCLTISTEANEMISQGLSGNKITYPTYTLDFQYKVNRIVISNRIIVRNNTTNRDLIQSAVNHKTKKLIVKYDCNNPYKSQITNN